MSTIKQYTSAGEAGADIAVDDAALVLDKGAQALKDAVVAIRNAMRAGTASTKGKGEAPTRSPGSRRARATPAPVSARARCGAAAAWRTVRSPVTSA